MGIFEALVTSLADLERPSGVLFDPRKESANADTEAWHNTLPLLKADWINGREIIVLIQARNRRVWNDKLKNYIFDKDEDCLIAAYSLAPSVGIAYKPATCINLWLDGVVPDPDAPDSAERNKIIKMFQCDEQGCKLSKLGLLTIINSYTLPPHDLPVSQAIIAGKLNMTDGVERDTPNGWQGKTFPRRMSAAQPARSRRYNLTTAR